MSDFVQKRLALQQDRVDAIPGLRSKQSWRALPRRPRQGFDEVDATVVCLANE